MAERGIFDQAVDEVLRLKGLVKAEIVRRNKGKIPFRKEEVSPKQQLFEYSQLTPEDFQFARENYGEEVVNGYITDMEKIARRYQDGRQG